MLRLITLLLLGPLPTLPARAQEHPPPAKADGAEGAYETVTRSRRRTTAAATGFPFGVDSREAETFPLVDNDLMRAVHVFPGVQASDYSARFALRGGEMDEVTFRLDGMELVAPYHLPDFGGSISAVDLNVTDGAVLQAGGFSAEYGDGMSGVYLVSGREGAEDGLHGQAGLDIINTHLLMDGPVGQGSWLASARRGYIDLLLDLMGAEVAFRPTFLDLYTKGVQRLGGRHSLWFHALYSRDTNEEARDTDEGDFESTYDSGVAWLTWEHPLGRGLGRLYLFGGGGVSVVEDGHLARDEREQAYAGVKEEVVYPLFTGNKLKAGGRLRWSWARYDYRSKDHMDLSSGESGPLDLEPSPEEIDATWYLQDEWKLMSSVHLNAGVRVLHQHHGTFAGPRAALAWSPIRPASLRLAWGRYHQPVLPLSLPVEEGATRTVRPEEADHYVVGLDLKHDPLELRIEAYQKYYRHLCGHMTDSGSKERAYTSPDSAEARGMDLLARLRLLDGKLSLLAGYALSRAEETSDGLTYPRSGDRRHAIIAGLTALLPLEIQLVLWWRYHSGTPYTPVTGEPGPDGFKRVYGEPNSHRLPSFHSLDLRLLREWSWTSWSLRAYLQVMNLYNRQNLEEIVYEEKGSGADAKLVEDEQYLFPILPTIGLEGVF